MANVLVLSFVDSIYDCNDRQKRESIDSHRVQRPKFLDAFLNDGLDLGQI